MWRLTLLTLMACGGAKDTPDDPTPVTPTGDTATSAYSVVVLDDVGSACIASSDSVDLGCLESNVFSATFRGNESVTCEPLTDDCA